jgi:hypothetical protein
VDNFEGKVMIGNWNESSKTSQVVWADGTISKFTLASNEPYKNKNGEQTELRVWRSICVTCGSGFQTKTSGKVPMQETRFTRRACDEHKATKWFGRTQLSQ